MTEFVAIPTLKTSYTHCVDITRTRARNFYYAFVTLPPAARRAICALYAYCRLLDDVADGPLPREEKSSSLAQMRTELHQAVAGQSSDPVFIAMAHAVKKYNISVDTLLEISDGVSQDLDVHRYKTFDELRRYCYLVASTVGLASLQIFGYRGVEARQAAIDLGIAMQLTNIVRDVAEDASRNRIYIPLEELDTFGVDEAEVLSGRSSSQMIRLLSFQVERAKQYYNRAQRLFQYLPRLSRPCPMVLFGVYRTILQKIEQNGYNVFTTRASLEKNKRAQIALSLWLRGLICAPPK